MCWVQARHGGCWGHRLLLLLLMMLYQSRKVLVPVHSSRSWSFLYLSGINRENSVSGPVVCCGEHNLYACRITVYQWWIFSSNYHIWPNKRACLNIRASRLLILTCYISETIYPIWIIFSAYKVMVYRCPTRNFHWNQMRLRVCFMPPCFYSVKYGNSMQKIGCQR